MAWIPRQIGGGTSEFGGTYVVTVRKRALLDGVGTHSSFKVEGDTINVAVGQVFIFGNSPNIQFKVGEDGDPNNPPNYFSLRKRDVNSIVGDGGIKWWERSVELVPAQV